MYGVKGYSMCEESDDVLISEVLTLMLPCIQVFWNIMPRQLVTSYCHFKRSSTFIFRVKQSKKRNQLFWTLSF